MESIDSLHSGNAIEMEEGNSVKISNLWGQSAVNMSFQTKLVIRNFGFVILPSTCVHQHVRECAKMSGSEWV